MALPPKTGQIDGGRRPGPHWNVSIQPSVRAVIVEIALIVEELSLQISSCPKEGMVQELSSNATDQSLDEWVRHRYVWN